MGNSIEILSAVVANQIAAGEVIERPASIVKELVENALDAGARRIDVSVREGGREEIIVQDDGSGMARADAERACLRHATSKLREIDEIERIASYGFRGEALASISSISKTTIETCESRAAEGTCIQVQQGKVLEVLPAGVPEGTKITVRELFASVPARRKFLRTAQTELAHISDWLLRAALARPEVAFSLTHGAREVFRHPAVADPGERLRQVQGATRAGEMLACSGEAHGIRVTGWVSRAGKSYPQSKAILSYVGGRVVRDRVLTRAVLDAYRALLPQGRYPAAVLFLELPPGEVDVNVHPGKVEVRFANGDQVYSAVLRTIRQALEDGIQAPAALETRGDVASTQEGSPSVGRGVSESSEVSARVEESLARYAARSGSRETRSYTIRPTEQATDRRDRAGVSVPGGSDRQDAMEFAAKGDAEPSSDGRPAGLPRFADLRVLGQAMNGYIVTESRDGLVLIDQHAAHERVRFERLRAQAATTIASQQLLVPSVVELDPTALAALEANADQLRAGGFEIDSFGTGRVVLRALPASLDVSTDVEVLLAELAREFAELGSRGTEERILAARDTLLARVACHGAVRVGDPLTMDEMKQLVADLDTIPFAATCPHGRPMVAPIPRGEIERRVLR